jgi:transferase hexapeptide repeat
MNWELINKVRRLKRTSLLKSAYLNFTLLPFRQALKFPFIVSKYTYFYSLSGKVEFMAPVRFGMVRIGFLGEDVVVPKNERSLLQIEGTMKIDDNVRLGCGVIIRVESNATLILGRDVRIGAKSRIIAYNSITIGDNTGISWDCQLLDSNMHDIVRIDTMKTINCSQPIEIGRNCWLGTHVTVMKGCRIPEYTIVSATSLCNQNYEIPPYSIIAGQPARLIRTGFKRADYK